MRAPGFWVTLLGRKATRQNWGEGTENSRPIQLYFREQDRGERNILFFRGAFVLHIDEAAAGHARLKKKDQRAMGNDRECFGFLFNGLPCESTLKADGTA